MATSRFLTTLQVKHKVYRCLKIFGIGYIRANNNVNGLKQPSTSVAGGTTTCSRCAKPHNSLLLKTSKWSLFFALMCSSLYTTVGLRGDKIMDKKPTSIRLSVEAKRLRKLLAKQLGVSESAVLELAIRELAEKKGVK